MLLNAEFDLALNPTLEEALQKGIPLYFVLEFELTRPRWYWLDEKVAQTVDRPTACRTTRSRGSTASRAACSAQTFNSLDEVERFIGRVTSRPVARADDARAAARATTPRCACGSTSTSCRSRSRSTRSRRASGAAIATGTAVALHAVSAHRAHP